MSRVASFLALTAFAILAFATPVRADDFTQCLCWDKANNEFCGGDKWYNSHACQTWFWKAFGWTIPAIAGMFILLVFPCLFYCARTCCHCCGGRHRTYGCCCADESTRHRFPGYSNRAIFVSKILMCAAFGFYTYYAVGGYVTNAKLHTDILNILDNIDGAVSTIEVLTNKTSTIATELVAIDLAPPQFASKSQSVITEFASRADQIHSRLHDLRNVERNQAWGRAESVYRYPSCVLFVFLLALFATFGNCRKLMGPLMILLCLSTIAEAIVFVPHMILAQGATAVCNHFNETAVPIVVGAIENQHGCNSASLIGDMNAVAFKYESQLFGQCENLKTICGSADCAFTFCAGSATGQLLNFTTGLDRAPFNIAGITMMMTASFGTKSSSSVQSAKNILDCATQCASGSAVQIAAQQVATWYTQTIQPVSGLLTEVFPATFNCSIVRDILQGSIHSDLCDGGVDRRLTNVSVVLGAMYLISILSIPVFIRGMKRFMPMTRRLQEVVVATIDHYDKTASGQRTASDDGVPQGDYQPINDDNSTEAQPLAPTRQSTQFREFYGVGGKQV